MAVNETRAVKIGEMVDDFNRKKVRVRKEIQERVNDLVEAEMYDDWLEIHKEIREALDSKAIKAGDMRVITRAYTNPGRYEYWRDYRERPDVKPIPKRKVTAPKTEPEPEPEIVVKDIGYRHKDGHGSDYEVTYKGNVFRMSWREPDGQFIREDKVSENYDKQQMGEYAFMPETLPREEHEEFLMRVKETIINAGLR